MSSIDHPGNLYVVAAPSGAGKSSLVNALLELDSHVVVSVSHTTRAPRGQEQDGREYHFIDEARFRAMIARGEFVEWAQVHDNLYGTSRNEVESHIAGGQDVVLEIDWQGALQVRRLVPGAVLVFILPPSIDSLRERLEKRGQDSPAVIARRLDAAREEMRHAAEFDYVIMNQDFARAVDDLSVIVRAARLAASRQFVRHARTLSELTDPSR